MRTTIDLEDDVLITARAVAHSRGVSLGKAVSALIRESFARPVSYEHADGLPVMPRVPGGGSPLTGGDLAGPIEAPEDAQLADFLMPGLKP